MVKRLGKMMGVFKKTSLLKNIIKLVLISPTLFSFIGNFASLIEDESKVARHQLMTMVILGLLAGVLLVSSWFTVLGILFLYLTSLQMSQMSSLFIIFMINIVFLIIIGIIVLRAKQKALFPETRQVFKRLVSKE